MKTNKTLLLVTLVIGFSARQVWAQETNTTDEIKGLRQAIEALEGKVPELYLIGDGKEAGMMVHAVRSGYQTAKSI